MLIAPAVAGLDACGVDRELDRWIGAEIEPALVVFELALGGPETPGVLDAKLNARALGVKPPEAGKRLDGAMVSMVGEGGHGCLFSVVASAVHAFTTRRDEGM